MFRELGMGIEVVGNLKSIINDPSINEDAKEGFENVLKGGGYYLRGWKGSLEDRLAVIEREKKFLDVQLEEVNALLAAIEEAKMVAHR